MISNKSENQNVFVNTIQHNMFARFLFLFGIIFNKFYKTTNTKDMMLPLTKNRINHELMTKPTSMLFKSIIGVTKTC
ncbi:MAG: hypothetical protein COA77_07365 [Thaumarchaeota archaeon]|nr:MAG: hypothetical protein COA77_07365 [Nitrososphaerota archaeon]